MKRSICILSIFLISCLTIPLTSHAKTYTISDTDISISMDDSSWYVFTRDNLQNNSELKELGIEPDAMYDILESNAAYLDAIELYEGGNFVELFIRKNRIENSITNLSNYSYEQVLEFAEAFGKKQNTENYSVYENQYKFARLEYFDSAYNYYICEFITMVNKDNYTLTFQSPSSFTYRELVKIQNIVDSVVFDIDSSLEEPMHIASKAHNAPTFLGQIVETGIIGGLSGGLIILIISFFKKIKTAEKTRTKNIIPKSNKLSEIGLTNQSNLEKFEYQQKPHTEGCTDYPSESISPKNTANDIGFEDIKKYKELLDLGIITQEEFDVKKKELLGL